MAGGPFPRKGAGVGAAGKCRRVIEGYIVFLSQIVFIDALDSWSSSTISFNTTSIAHMYYTNIHPPTFLISSLQSRMFSRQAVDVQSRRERAEVLGRMGKEIAKETAGGDNGGEVEGDNLGTLDGKEVLKDQQADTSIPLGSARAVAIDTVGPPAEDAGPVGAVDDSFATEVSDAIGVTDATGIGPTSDIGPIDVYIDDSFATEVSDAIEDDHGGGGVNGEASTSSSATETAVRALVAALPTPGNSAPPSRQNSRSLSLSLDPPPLNSRRERDMVFPVKNSGRKSSNSHNYRDTSAAGREREQALLSPADGGSFIRQSHALYAALGIGIPLPQDQAVDVPQDLAVLNAEYAPSVFANITTVTTRAPISPREPTPSDFINITNITSRAPTSPREPAPSTRPSLSRWWSKNNYGSGSELRGQKNESGRGSSSRLQLISPPVLPMGSISVSVAGEKQQAQEKGKKKSRIKKVVI